MGLAWFQSNGLSAGLQTKGLPVEFPVRAHAQVAGQVPSKRCKRGNNMMFFSLPFSLPSPLSNNKEIKYQKNRKMGRKFPLPIHTHPLLKFQIPQRKCYIENTQSWRGLALFLVLDDSYVITKLNGLWCLSNVNIRHICRSEG